MTDIGTGRGAAVLGAAVLDGEALTPRQRATIAALAYHHDDGASTDTLVDAVWAGSAPPSARQSVQNQIARLRRRFGDGVITTEGGRYRLGRARDVDRFERLTQPWLGGRAVPAAIPVLEEALALWRGAPFEDLHDHVGAEAERARLGELRAATAEHLAACRIADNDLVTATASLSSLVEEDPYRERRWELLIVALHLAGRRTEAVSAYERLAACLGEDLRCQPSITVQHLRTGVERDAPLDIRSHLDGQPTETVGARRGPGCARRRQHRHRTSCAGRYRQA